MTLGIGSENADSGMSQAIFQEMDRFLSPPLQDAIDAAEGEAKNAVQAALDGARQGWRQLSYAIARGVIEHLTANMEIFGIQTQGDVNTVVRGNTAAAIPSNHVHSVNLSGAQDDVVFTQNNDGTGHVR